MTQTQAPAQTKALKPIDEVRNNLARMGDQFKMALPAHIPVDKFMRVAQTAIASSPSLLKANRASLFQACTRAAQAGLLPDGKESALVPFKDQIQFMPMIAGILKLIRNSGELSTIVAEIVYEKDNFRYWIDDKGQQLIHEPLMFGERGKAIGVYGLAKLKDGGLYVEMMSEKQVMDVKAVSRSGTTGPWTGPFAHEMWKKTVIRRLAKRLPVSTDLDMVFKADDELYDLEQPTPDEAVAKKTKSTRLKNMMGVATERTVSEPKPEPQPEAQAQEPEPHTGEDTSELEEDLSEDTRAENDLPI